MDTASRPGTTVNRALTGRPFRVRHITEVLVDDSRPTEAGSATPALPNRTLPTDIYLPEPDGSAGTGPLPFILFSHGLSGHPAKFTHLLTSWAQAGYVVAAPAFPITNVNVPGSSDNWIGVGNQPADVSFVITELLRRNDDPASPVHGRIDPNRIGAAGLSLGGATTYAVTFHERWHDDRIQAAEVLSGALIPVGPGDYHLDGHVPLLIIHSDNDTSLPYRLATEAYAQAAPPVWFVTLQGGGHSFPFEDWDTPFNPIAQKMTLDFWDATLAGDGSALARFAADAVVPGRSTLSSRPS
jgi:dienelactone hydrolase